MPNLKAGGTESRMVDWANLYAKIGYSVDFLLLKAEGRYLQNLDAQIQGCDLGAPGYLLGFIKLLTHFRKHSPDVVVSSIELANLMLLLVLWLLGKSPIIIIRVASNYSKKRRASWKRWLYRKFNTALLPRADRIICVSRHSAEDLEAFAEIPLNAITIIQNPAPMQKIARMKSEEVPFNWLNTKKEPVIIGLGRLEKIKGFEDLIQAVDIINQEIKTKLLVPGEGSERNVLENLVRQLGLEGRVYLPGYVENPYKYLSRADVFVLSSHYEGSPNALLEAIGCGAPVVCTDCPGGVREILGDGRYGELVPVGDPESMAEAIIRVLRGGAKPVGQSWFEQFSEEEYQRKLLSLLDPVK